MGQVCARYYRRKGGEGGGGESDEARRTGRSLCGIGLFDLNFLQLFLQPSRIDDGHGARWWGVGKRGCSVLCALGKGRG